MTKNKKYLLLSLSTLALLSAASCSSGGASAESGEAVQDSARTVELAVVQVQPLRLMQEFTAQLEAKVTNNITAQSGGRLKQLLVKVGDRVLFGKFTGSEVKVDGEDYVIMREEEIFAVIQ